MSQPATQIKRRTKKARGMFEIVPTAVSKMDLPVEDSDDSTIAHCHRQTSGRWITDSTRGELSLHGTKLLQVCDEESLEYAGAALRSLRSSVDNSREGKHRAETSLSSIWYMVDTTLIILEISFFVSPCGLSQDMSGSPHLNLMTCERGHAFPVECWARACH